MSELDARQSELIKAMRFPLIVLVLFEHSVGADLAPMRRSLDGANIFHFTTELISRHFCSIAVCWFFVLSGFLFFRNLKEGEAGKGWFVDKWKRRTHTLLIPHLFWNLFYVLVILAVSGEGGTSSSHNPGILSIVSYRCLTASTMSLLCGGQREADYP